MSVTQLASASCSSPFSVLSWQPGATKGLMIRAYLPDAAKVEVFDFATRKSLGLMTAKPVLHGLFELELPAKRKTSPYYFQIETPHHHSYELVDPYQFEEEAYYAVHFVNSKPENLYKQLGAQLIVLNLGKNKLNATRFAVFAPNASSVSLIGDMNQWDGRRHPVGLQHIAAAPRSAKWQQAPKALTSRPE